MKNIIVTGCSKGIGRATIEALVNAGYQVAGISRSKPDFTHELFTHFQCDVSNENKVEDAFKKITSHFNEAIDGLVNNAAMGHKATLEETDTDKWHQLFNLNVHGVYYFTKRVLPYMKKAEQGNIINITSGAACNGIAEMSCYCGTKHAVKGISHALHQEVRDYGIKVTCIEPGSVHSHFAEAMGMPPTKKNAMEPEEIAQSIVHILQLPQNYHYQDLVVRPLQPNKV